MAGITTLEGLHGRARGRVLPRGPMVRGGLLGRARFLGEASPDFGAQVDAIMAKYADMAKANGNTLTWEMNQARAKEIQVVQDAEIAWHKAQEAAKTAASAPTYVLTRAPMPEPQMISTEAPKTVFANAPSPVIEPTPAPAPATSAPVDIPTSAPSGVTTSAPLVNPPASPDVAPAMDWGALREDIRQLRAEGKSPADILAMAKGSESEALIAQGMKEDAEIARLMSSGASKLILPLLALGAAYLILKG